MEAFGYDAMLKQQSILPMGLPTALGPILEITNHTSLNEEKVTRFGQTYNVHVVVKNSPFVVTVAMRGNSRGHSFNHLAFDISLIYDMPGLDKPVTYVSTKPVDYKPLISDSGDEISFDVKIKVLSSHHEDNFFRLRIEVWDPLEKSGFQPMHVITAPIKVISKPLKPKTAQKQKKPPVPAPKRKAQEMADSDDDSGGAAQNGDIESQLETLQRQQAEALRLLNILVETQRGGHLSLGPPSLFGQVQGSNGPSSNGNSNSSGASGANPTGSAPSHGSGSGPGSNTGFGAAVSGLGNNGFSFNAPTPHSAPGSSVNLEPPSKRVKIDGQNTNARPIEGNKEEFEGAFSTMLRSYAAMTAEEKAEKTRKLIRALGSRELELLEELFDILATAGVKTNTNGAHFSAATFHSDQCGEDCVHKEELMRIDQFYNEVFF